MNDNIKAGSDIHAGDGGYSIGTQEKYDEFVKGRNQSLGKSRIRELAIEAGIISAEYNGFDRTTITKAEEKFAELIVQECILVIEENAEHIHAEGTVEAIVNLEKHFGVE
jgi:hypothetical protein